MNHFIEYKNAAEDNILFRVDYERFLEYQFTFQEMLIVLLIIDGYDITEIAERNGYSRRQVTRILKVIRAKFEKFLCLIS